MVDIKSLLPELRKIVVELAEDLLAQSIADTAIDAGLREAFQKIEEGGRTAQAFETWRDDYLDQVAVAWVLACVFVRFMEDNELIDECWLAGEGSRRKLAEDSYDLYFGAHPHDTDREYFQNVFREVGKIAAAKDLFVEGKTPLWAVAPSGDAAMKLLKFWREPIPETGFLKRSFKVDGSDTRFLGDLYQELSERAKKKFALLQTPVFVEEFILDRTLTPALAEFGLEKVRMIDPTCGSGHFLLGGFTRLFALWSKPDHTTGSAEKDAQNALDGVWGVDINPFAVAIARFRLIVAAQQACGIKRLRNAPSWNIHLASGDSLLFGSKPCFKGDRIGLAQQLTLFEVPAIYATEDRIVLQEILSQGYHVVVGNPPYITVKDSAQNAAYRQLYSTCHQKFSLGAPFAQRFWELGTQIGELNDSCGYIGQITANSFMKREFGKKLIEDFFSKIDLTHVIDTSGAYIPGHGTPTVILLGRSRRPVGNTVRAVLGIKGEPSTPKDPAQGLVWLSILQHVDRVNSIDSFTSSVDILRSTLASHPWSMGGGGAAELKERLESEAASSLGKHCDSIGFMVITGCDEVVVAPKRVFERGTLPHRDFVTGEQLRDWQIRLDESVLFVYDDALPGLPSVPEKTNLSMDKFLWPNRTVLRNRSMFGKTPEEHGLRWYEFIQFIRPRVLSQKFIAYTVVSTHNQFVMGRENWIYNPHAPIIKLPADATEDDYLGLLGLLNSSAACFWMHQMFHNKGRPGADAAAADERWEFRFEHDGTKLRRFPVPVDRPLTLARSLDTLAQEYASLAPNVVVAKRTPNEELLKEARLQAESIRRRMIALQEELDWKCYQHYGLLEKSLCYEGGDLPEVTLGQRAFEIVLARQVASGALETAWFDRFRSKPSTELPSYWPSEYRKLVEDRIKVIESREEIGLIDAPEFKRRWQEESWEAQQLEALKQWLLDRLETPLYRSDSTDTPELTTTAIIAGIASADREFMQIAALFRGRPDFDLSALIAELVEAESVPFLPVLRYKISGLRKREIWEYTWDFQRQEDAGQSIDVIPVPPKYATADFLETEYWRLRGKLDVPKERWISYLHCSTESDPSLVVLWAGCNHLQQSTALISYYDARKREGWNAKRLAPLLAGLDQLLPWIHQWHPEIDPEFGETAGQSFQTLLEHDAHELGLTIEDIRNWTPPEKVKKTRITRKNLKAVEGEE